MFKRVYLQSTKEIKQKAQQRNTLLQTSASALTNKGKSSALFSGSRKRRLENERQDALTVDKQERVKSRHGSKA
ncbi:MAG: hypothetical protein NXI01_08955 [Gammaproteobacteria bacterium]|nr:hypothetical protein [Gammaproteobacteria bacterium]